MADPLYHILKANQKGIMRSGGSEYADAISMSPFFYKRGEVNPGRVILKEGLDPKYLQEEVLPHEKFHQAQFLADLVKKVSKNPDFMGRGFAGNEIGDKDDPVVQKLFRNYLNTHYNESWTPGSTDISEFPAYEFTKRDYSYSSPNDWSKKMRALGLERQQVNFNDYMDLVRSRNPTTANIISQEMDPRLVLENVVSHPQPIPFSLPEMKEESLLDLLKKLRK